MDALERRLETRILRSRAQLRRTMIMLLVKRSGNFHQCVSSHLCWKRGIVVNSVRGSRGLLFEVLAMDDSSMAILWTDFIPGLTRAHAPSLCPCPCPWTTTAAAVGECSRNSQPVKVQFCMRQTYEKRLTGPWVCPILPRRSFNTGEDDPRKDERPPGNVSDGTPREGMVQGWYVAGRKDVKWVVVVRECTSLGKAS